MKKEINLSIYNVFIMYYKVYTSAIGQIGPLHYLFIVVDGRSEESNGMTLSSLAEEFKERGASVAYNLDGGGSSSMCLNGNLLNNPTDGRKIGERSISDIIYIGE